jgi:hypothetical protein
MTEPGWKDHSSGENRAGKTAAAGFIAASLCELFLEERTQHIKHSAIQSFKHSEIGILIFWRSTFDCLNGLM